MKAIRYILVAAIVAVIVGYFYFLGKHGSRMYNQYYNQYFAVHTPFVNTLGIDYSVMMTSWFNNDSIKYNSDVKNNVTYLRLKSITTNSPFKLVRVYCLLIAGWEQTGDITPEAYALARVCKENPIVEGVLGTSCRKDWYEDSTNTDLYAKTLKSTFGASIKQVKAIVIGNEINSNGYTAQDVKTTITLLKKSMAKYGMSNIPITTSFSNLPIHSGDALSDSCVKQIVLNWNPKWNNGYPFVFINPYPDAPAIDSAKGIYNWQSKVQVYYRTFYPKFQAYIGETGSEGSLSDSASVVVLNQIFSVINKQKNKVPTFIFEAVNEPVKPAENQRHMGVFQDPSSPFNCNEKPKTNIKF